MKKALLIFLLIFTSYANSYFDTNHYYAQLLLGGNFIQTNSDNDISPNFNAGILTAGSLGYYWCNGINFEFEYSYRENSVKNLKKKHLEHHLHARGHYQSSSYMANLIYDLPWSYYVYNPWGMQPYVGGGLGYDHQLVRVKQDQYGFKKTKKHFAWQFMVGVSYSFCGMPDISLEYRFHRGGFHELINHALCIGFSWDAVFSSDR